VGLLEPVSRPGGWRRRHTTTYWEWSALVVEKTKEDAKYNRPATGDIDPS
jgi:hypothetical protein